MTLQWRRLNFFDFQIKDEIVQNNLKDEVRLICIRNDQSDGRHSGFILLADTGGFLHAFDKNFHSVVSSTVFNIGLKLLVRTSQIDVAVVVGEDNGDDGVVFCLKVLKINKNGEVIVLRAVQFFASEGSDSLVATSLAVNKDQNLMAVGFQNGLILLYRGDISINRRSSKPKEMYRSECSITGLFFKTSFGHNGEVNSYLYVATQREILCFNIFKSKESLFKLDSVGCETGLAVFNETNDFVVAGKDAVYYYTQESRGDCYGFEGAKVDIACFSSYLALVTEDETQIRTLTVFDVRNKFVAFSSLDADWPMVPTIMNIFSYGKSLFVVMSNHSIICLKEHDMSSKLMSLCSKNYYDIAIRLTTTDDKNQAEIFRKYGDYLYAKANYSEAMDKYIKTIGHGLEPSYVIKLFLDARHTKYLKLYLQALQPKMNEEEEDLATLLLNCYAKLKESDELDKFICAMLNDNNSQFRVETAINICYDAGYTDHALRLAEKKGFFEWYLRIKLEDQGDIEGGLSYINDNFEMISVDIIQNYGSLLVKRRPDEMTKLFVKLCCRQEAKMDPKDLLHFLTFHSKQMILFIEDVLDCFNEAVADVGTLQDVLLHHNLLLWREEEGKFGDDKILTLLRSHDRKYNQDRALVLCRSFDFQAGFLYLYEQKRMFSTILSFYAKSNNMKALVDTCRKYATQQPRLWVEALHYVAADSSCISEILDNIEKYRLMSPTMVVEVLSSNSSSMFTFVSIKKYLLGILRADQRQIVSNSRLNAEFDQEIQQVQSRIDVLRNKCIIFQSSKCNACQGVLELPAVHLMCQHSFHQHCFSRFSEKIGCPTCRTGNAKISDMLQAKKEISGGAIHDAFHHQLSTAQDPFDIMSEYLGRGIFNPEYTRANLRISKSAEVRHKSSGLNSHINDKELMTKAVVGKNPFEENDNDRLIDVPENLNPFSEDHDKHINTNPFSDQDEEDLNPFRDD